VVQDWGVGSAETEAETEAETDDGLAEVCSLEDGRDAEGVGAAEGEVHPDITTAAHPRQATSHR
jgi:hypothetical protein